MRALPLAILLLTSLPILADEHELSVPTQFAIANKVNETLVISHLKPVLAPKIDGKQPSAVFKWSLTSPVYQFMFDPESYITSTDQVPGGSPVAGYLCETIKEVHRQKRRLPPEIFRDHDDGELSIGPYISARDVELGLKISGPLEWWGQLAADFGVTLTNLYYYVAEDTEYREFYFEVYSLGMASYASFSEKDLEPPPYDFSRVTLRERDTSRRVNFSYARTPITLTIGDRYDNDELPDLRAKFFDFEFVEPLMNGCFSFIRESGVLKGHVHDAFDDRPDLRRVDVYIFVFSAQR